MFHSTRDLVWGGSGFSTSCPALSAARALTKSVCHSFSALTYEFLFGSYMCRIARLLWICLALRRYQFADDHLILTVDSR